MANIVHCRVDDRLIHGQVATSWLPHTKANLCLIANDDVAVNDSQKLLLAMAVPEGVDLRCFSIERALQIINKAAPHQKIFVLLRSISDAARLVKGGFPITQINLGNISAKAGAENLFRTIYVTQEERAMLKEIMQQGVALTYCLLPTDQIVTLDGKTL
ncbi:PTS sugar transporter subunit IIB [Atlantibacter sp.]|uniref:PTS sugar transporter subunit IIB n=1 Tax=Atlantibacter sp. TaxID=1903473 RepID=UPI0028B0343F|nr:PTS sugar transporter subunit IIB [Atlantibacter sp.]